MSHLTNDNPRTRACVLCLAIVLCAPAAGARAQENQSDPHVLSVIDETDREPKGPIAEPTVVRRVVVYGDRHSGNGDLTSGIYVDMWSMIPGAGLSAGPGYRRWFSQDRVVADMSAALSWNRYQTAQARLELPRLLRSRLAAGSQFRWQNFRQVNFYGTGPGTTPFDQTDYRLMSWDAVGYATVRPVRWLGIGVEAGWLDPWIRPRVGNFVDSHDALSAARVFALNEEPSFFHTETSVTADKRDFPGHPTRGGVVRLARTTYSDRQTGAFSFSQYEAEAAGFVPFADSRLVLAGRGWLVATDTASGRSVPFYLLPSLGGSNTLRGFSDYRFHDRNMVVLNVEARVPMMVHVDAAAFVDAGNVGARIGDLNLGKRSYGVGLRLHSHRQTYARLDVGHSVEGWHLSFNFLDPFTLGRHSRRTAIVPFVP